MNGYFRETCKLYTVHPIGITLLEKCNPRIPEFFLADISDTGAQFT